MPVHVILAVFQVWSPRVSWAGLSPSLADILMHCQQWSCSAVHLAAVSVLAW